MLQIIVTITIGQAVLMNPVELEKGLQSGTVNLGNYVLTMLLLLLFSLWIAVGWHRYVLKNERPEFVPRLYMDRMLGYLGHSILIGLLVLPIVLLLGLLMTLAFGPLFLEQIQANPFASAAMFGMLLYVPVGTVAMRLSSALPGVAMEPGVSVFAGWRATAGQTWPVMGVVVLSVFGALLLNLPNVLFFAPTSVPGLVWHFVSQWVTVMVGVSILTTFYGHFVEGRPLV
ncbi:MAG: hypothetical protein ACRCS3_01475 [Paracoccaceae bacterium]